MIHVPDRKERSADANVLVQTLTFEMVIITMTTPPLINTGTIALFCNLQQKVLQLHIA
jgi:hypothetical protein